MNTQKIILEWIRCPVCGNKTCDRVREDTILENFPLFCPKCKNETIIDVKQMNTTVIMEPDAKLQRRIPVSIFTSLVYYSAFLIAAMV